MFLVDKLLACGRVGARGFELSATGLSLFVGAFRVRGWHPASVRPCNLSLQGKVSGGEAHSIIRLAIV